MKNGSTTHIGGKVPPFVHRLVCAGGLLLCAGWAAAQDKAAAPPALEAFDKAQFDDRSTTINNPLLPMKPGMRYIYEGTTSKDDGKLVPHRIEINITDLTKVVEGVRVLVSYDLDFSGGKLEEAELAFFAQDKAGNVWHFGQYPEEYQNGKMTKAPAWIPPFEGAHPGIMMKAEPKLGAPSYSQGYGPAVNWTDRGQTHQVGQRTKTRAGSYEDVVVIRETAAGEGDAFQLKYYARGVGNVRVGWTGADKSKEVLELVRIETMSPKALADVRAKALKLEKSAYVNSKNVYAKTAPAETLK